MRVKQFVGPFIKPEERILNLNLGDAHVVQVGVEFPRKQPWAFFEDDYLYTPTIDLEINGEEYIITEREILEWQDLDFADFSIKINQSSPYMIITVAYE